MLDNHRWLHARTAYTGARTLYRLLGNPRTDLDLRTGIPLPDPAPAHPDVDELDEQAGDQPALEETHGAELAGDAQGVRETR